MGKITLSEAGLRYYVVYQNREIIRGPLSRKDADNTAEDLDMAFEDPNYKVLDEEEVMKLDLLPPTTRN